MDKREKAGIRSAHARGGSGSAIHLVPAGVKLLLAAGLIAALWFVPMGWAWLLGIPAVGLAAVVLSAGVRVGPFLKRLLVLEPFVMGVALLALLTPPPTGGLLPFLFLAARSTLCLMALLTFSAVTPFTDVLGLMRWLHVPQLLLTTLALMHRYTYVLGDEAGRMKRARASRTFAPRRRLAWTTASSVVAQLFLRASARADRIYSAMRARGWGG
jgi:cobalt/nickel transport system permease protein